jgi:hypothetical protein
VPTVLRGRADVLPTWSTAPPACAYDTASLDRGRVSVLRAARLLGWVPGERLAGAFIHRRVELRAAGDGHLVVDEDVRVGLPHVLRGQLGVARDDRVLVVTDPHRRRVVIVHLGEVDALLWG